MNINDRVALHIGRQTISQLESAAILDEQNAVLTRAWAALAQAAKDGDPPDLDKLKAEDKQFAAWLEQQK